MIKNERQIVKMTKEICDELSIQYKLYCDDWLINMKHGWLTKNIFGYNFELNSAATMLICEDKCATSHILTDNNIPCVMHEMYFKNNNNWSNLNEYLFAHTNLVCKINNGTGGKDVYCVTNNKELEEATAKIFSKSRIMAVSEYIPAVAEYRVIVLDGNVELVFSKERPYIIGDGEKTIYDILILDKNNIRYLETLENDLDKVLAKDEIYYLNWKHNLFQGATPKIIYDEALKMQLAELAKKAVNALNIGFASVDVFEKENGELLILEVNGGIMMEHFSKVSPEHYNISKDIYMKAIKKMFGII